MNTQLSALPKADLHMHTTSSDGAFSAPDVVRMAHAAGLSTISITDHDTVDAVPEAIAAAKELGMTCIPGIELTAICGGVDIHILGYFFDHTSKVLHEFIDRACIKRTERAQKIIAKLNALGVALTMSDVMKRALGAAIGRPHIAGALIDRGFVPNYQKAFHLYLADNGPAYEHIDTLTLAEAVELLHNLGGIAVIAHPAVLKEEILKEAIEAGVDGIEVIHPSSFPNKVELFRSIATEYFLVQTGGSDFHGGVRNDNQNLGRYFVGEEYVTKMKAVLHY